MPTQGEIVKMAWKCPHKVRMPMWGENAHTRWECPCEMTFQMVEGVPHYTLESDLACMQDENSHKGGNVHVWLKCPHEMKMSTWDENAHTRWECPCEMTFQMLKGIPDYTWEGDLACIQSEDALKRSKCAWEVRMPTWNHFSYSGGDTPPYLTKWSCMHVMRKCSHNNGGDTHHILEIDLACMQDKNAHTRSEWPYEVKMPTWGENVLSRWECPCEVRMSTQG